MSRVDTMRSCAAHRSTTSSESRWVHGVCASSSTPAPSARSTWPAPCACAVTGSSTSCAASQIAASSASETTGPASAFKETLIAVAPDAESWRTAATASSGSVISRPVPGGAHDARVGYPSRTVIIGHARRLRHAGFAELTELLPQLVDLVPQSSGVFEAEVLRRLMHLLLEALDQPLELVRGHLRVRASLPPLLARRGRSLIVATERQ